MHIRLTSRHAAWLRGSAAVLAAAFLATGHLSSQAQPPRPPIPEGGVSAMEGGRLEKIGPTMSRVVPRRTPYDRWLATYKTSNPVFEGMVIQNVHTVALKPWAEMGGNGLYVRLADYQITDGVIMEIPPGGSLKPHKHMYEEMIYFLGGPGHTIIQQEGRRPERIDWQNRSLFAVPLNVKHQHFNDSDQPVRYLAVTSLPYIINSTNNIDFVYKNPFNFTDRYNAQEDYLKVNEHRNRSTRTNLVKDALEFKLDLWDERGKDSTTMNWDMGGDTQLSTHVSEIPVQLYKKAHRHSSDAFILMLSGDGYSLTWPEGGDRVRVNWTEGTLFVPPIYWYHQHLNPGKEPARYLAINAPSLVSNLGLRFEDQIEVDLPGIESEFNAEIKKRGSK